MKNITEELKEKAKIKLQAYTDERLLENEILIPLYKSMGFNNIERVHNQIERKHKSDLLISKTGDIGFYGIQVKCSNTKNNIDNNPTLVSSIYQDGRTATKYYVDESKKSMTHYFWVTMGEITPLIGRKHITNECPEDFMGKVFFKDVNDIIEDIINNKPDLISGLEIITLLDKLNSYDKNKNKVFAAHFAFKIFIDQLLDGELTNAKQYLQQAISLIAEQENSHIFYIRSLTKFYKHWEKIIEYNKLKQIIDDLKIEKQKVQEFDKTWDECILLLRIVNHHKIKELMEPNKNGSDKVIQDSYLFDYNFLCDFQYIFSQLQILFYEYADSPTGLSSKQICRTLMRFGFPPIGKLADRISRMKEELKYENNCSVDGECSLCTGTVLSCLILADEDKLIIEKVKGWLETLDYCRYSHLKRDSYSSEEAGNTEHALHYSAQVLQAFVDYGDSVNSNNVLKHYFTSENVGKDGFYDEWMMHRNITNLETCAYIFSAFHRYFITNKDGFQFNETQLKFIKKAIVNLFEVLHNETTPQSKVSRLYSTRENIQSLCLGLLVGAKETTISLLRELMQSIHARATRIRKDEDFTNPTFKQKRLLDSNVDRTNKLIEGWVSYWESIFYLINDAPDFDKNGFRIKKTIKELKEEGYFPNYP
jgi:hypothetical protein